MAYSVVGFQSYGDPDNVVRDAKIIREIIDRQGSDILLECIADHVGDVNSKYSLSASQIDKVKKSLADSIILLIEERT